MNFRRGLTAVALSICTVLGFTAWAGSGPDLSPAFVRAGDEQQINTLSAGPQFAPEVAAKRDGGFVVVWAGDDASNAGQIWSQRFFRNGTPAGGETRANSGPQISNQSNIDLRVAYHDTGKFSVFWKLNTGLGVFFMQHVLSDGTPDGPITVLNPLDASTNLAVAAGLGDQSVTAWFEQSEGIRTVVYDEQGIAVTTEAAVNTQACLFRDCVPAVGADSAGNYVVAWTQVAPSAISTRRIHARRFAADGTPLALDFQVNTSSDESLKLYPDVGVSSDGKFMVVWAADSFETFPGTDETEIHGRIFNADGTPRTGEIDINLFTAGYQRRPRVAANDDGTFTVIWQSADQDGDGAAIVGQAFSVDGVRLSGETLVNSQPLGQQDDPRIASNGQDLFAVWESRDQDGSGEGVFGQAFRPMDLFQDGFESGTTAAWSVSVP